MSMPRKTQKTFHGINKFNIEQVSDHKAKRVFLLYLASICVYIAEKDKRICGITAAMAPGVGLDKFAELYKERFFDVGIAEQHAVTFAGGLPAKYGTCVCSV